MSWSGQWRKFRINTDISASVCTLSQSFIYRPYRKNDTFLINREILLHIHSLITSVPTDNDARIGHTANIFRDLVVKRWPITIFKTDNNIARPLQWRHNERHGVSNHQRHDCLTNRLFRRISKKTSKIRVTGLCEGNSPVTGEFPAQSSSNTENVPFDDVIMRKV